MNIFMHINELEDGWNIFPYSSLFSQKTSLWSPSAKRLELEYAKGNSVISPDDLLPLVEAGTVRVFGRDEWINNPKRFEDSDNETLHWEHRFDSEIARIAYEDRSKPNNEKRVFVAGSEGGSKFAEDQLELNSDEYELALHMVKSNEIPHSVSINLRVDLDRTDEKKALRLLQVFKNHEDARILSGSDILVEKEGFPVGEYSAIVNRQPNHWSPNHEFSETKISEFIHLAEQIGPIDTKEKYLVIARDDELKKEVNEFIRSEMSYRHAVINQISKGIVKDSVFADLVHDNPIVQGISLASLIVGLGPIAIDIKKNSTISRRAVVKGALGSLGLMVFGPAATVAYRGAQKSSLADLRDKYAGPKFPVMLALGRKSATLNEMIKLLDNLKQRLIVT